MNSQLLGRDQTFGEEIANSISHGVGALAGLISGIIILVNSIGNQNAITIFSLCVFICTVFILYLTSSLYHALPRNRSKTIFRIFDHAAIYLLIAGTYTPFSLGVLQGKLGWIIFSVIWTIAIFGITLKAFHVGSASWLSTILYLIMGWMGILVINSLSQNLSRSSFWWLVAGGIIYSLGVLFFVLDEKIRYSHFIWHIFVLLGTSCHFTSLFLIMT